MIPAGITRAIEAVERRGEDLNLMFASGAQPNYADALRPERTETATSGLSVTLPPDAYLVSGNPDRPAYTRDGVLSVRDGLLVASDGTPVLGFPNDDRSGVPRELRIERNDAILGRAQDLRIEADGTFGYGRTVVDPETLDAEVERVVVGRIALARFPAGTQLERAGDTQAKAPAGIVPYVGMPNDGSFSALVPQSRAIGRLDPDATISRLQDAYLALRALGAVERSRNGMVRDALDLVK
jgi:hypothetical protein